MPELPEVETIKRQLDAVLVGQTVSAIRVRQDKSFQGSANRVIGKKVVGVGRKAKMLVIELSSQSIPGYTRFAGSGPPRPRDLRDQSCMLVHLKMTGQLIYDEKAQSTKHEIRNRYKDCKPHFKVKGRVVGGHPTSDWVSTLPSRHTRVVIELSKGRLFFNDMRMFGWVKVVESGEWEMQRARMAPDVTDQSFTLDYFSGVLDKTRVAIKTVMLDQQRMGGIGNIYANDALWRARIDPRRPAQSLLPAEVKRLYAAVREVIAKGIALGGASESDYVDIRGLGGRYQEHFLTYKRDGKRCRRKGCGGVVEKIYLGGRGTYLCVRCQG